MKLLASLAATIAIASSLTCDMAKVPTDNMVCIQPEYIEGCYQYKSAQMCNKCQFSTIIFIKIINYWKTEGVSINKPTTSNAAFKEINLDFVLNVIQAYISYKINVLK